MRMIGRQRHWGLTLAKAGRHCVAVCLIAAALEITSVLPIVRQTVETCFSWTFGIAEAQARRGGRSPVEQKPVQVTPPKPVQVAPSQNNAPKVTQPTAKPVQQQSKNVRDDDDDDDRKPAAPARNDAKTDTSKAKQTKDDDDDRDAGKKTTDKGRSRAVDTDADMAIPSTVEGLVKRWFTPAVPSVQAGAGAPPSLQRSLEGLRPKVEPIKQIPPKAEAAVKAAPVPAKQPLQVRRPVGNLALQMPSLNNREVLARNLSAATLQRALSAGMEVQSSQTFGVLGFSLTRLTVPTHMDPVQAKSLLQESNPGAGVDLNRTYQLVPSAKEEDSGRASPDPARPIGGCASERCYGAVTIGWQAPLAACASDLKIGVIDTGIDGSHPALSGSPERINHGTIGPERRAARSDLHGTGVLALLAGDPKSTTPGLVPRAKFYVADIFFAGENGQPVSTTLHLLEALDWMDSMQVQIVNLSLSGPRDDLVQAAIAKMSRPRTIGGHARAPTIFIAAAGNGGPGAPPSYPAAYSQVIAVTAVGKDLRSYPRANQGKYIDLAAPGINIWTALPNGKQGFQSGTSFAAPYVTAIVASMYRGLSGAERGKNGIIQRLAVQDLGPPGPDAVYGRGLVQAPTSCNPLPTPAIAARKGAPTTRVSQNRAQ
jgi:hypothetical protein